MPNSVSPPIRELRIRTIGDGKEDHNAANGQSGIQRSREHIVVLCPPGVEAAVDDLVEYQVDNIPRRVVDTGSGRDIVRADKDEGPVDLADKIGARLFPDEVGNGRQDEADPEEMQQARVDGADRVQARGADQTPNDRRGEDGAAVGAGEAVLLVLGADVVDVAQHPQGHARLGQGAEDGGDALGEEESARRNLEVVAELQVRGKVEALADDVGGQDLEQNVGNGLALEHVAADELGEDVELVGVDVGHALDHAAGDHVDGGDDVGQDDSPPGQARVVAHGGADAHAHDDEQDGGPPPPLDSGVRAHETGVNVQLQGAAEGVFDLVPVKEVHMGQHTGITR